MDKRGELTGSRRVGGHREAGPSAAPVAPGRVTRGVVVQPKLATPGRATAVKEPAPTGAGAPLPAPVRARMEAALGASFATVRVHEDGQAGELGARAVARGEDIFFAPGEYDPTSGRGAELLAHELTHVVQQRGGRARGGDDAPWLAQDPSLEAEADAAAAKVAATPAAPAGTAAPTTAAPVASGAAVAQRKLEAADGGKVTGAMRAGDRLIETDISSAFADAEFTFVQSLGNGRILVRGLGEDWAYDLETGSYDEPPRRLPRAMPGRSKAIPAKRGPADDSDDEREAKGRMKPAAVKKKSPVERKQRKAADSDEDREDRWSRERRKDRKHRDDSPQAPNLKKRGEAEHRGKHDDDHSPLALVRRTEQMSNVTEGLRPAKAKPKSNAKPRVLWPSDDYTSGSESEDSDFEPEPVEPRRRQKDPLRPSESITTMRQHQTALVARQRKPAAPAVEIRRELQVYWRYLEDRIAFLETLAKRAAFEADDEDDFEPEGNAAKDRALELERLRAEHKALAATRAHAEALDDAEVDAYNRRLRDDPEHAAEAAPNVFVRQSRGIHYSRANFTQDERRHHRKHSEIGAPVFSAASYEVLNQELVKHQVAEVHPGDPRLDRHDDEFDPELFEMLEQVARGIRTRIQGLATQSAKHVPVGGGERAELGVPFDNLGDVHQTVYSNSYASYHDATELASKGGTPKDPRLAAVFAALFTKGQPTWTSNPMVSTGDEAEHPQRYSLGDKPPTGVNSKTHREFREERLRPRYNNSGEGDPHARRPYSGKTYLSLHPAEEMLGPTAPSHVSSMQGQWQTDVGHRIFTETESSFAGLLESDRVVYHQDAKFPSFVGDYDPAYELKYGLDRGTYEHYQRVFTRGGVQGDDHVKQAKRELAALLAKHNGHRADDEADLQAARMGGVARSRDLDGGFGREAATPPEVHHRRRGLASLQHAANLARQIDAGEDRTGSVQRALAQYASQFDLEPGPFKALVAGKSFHELRRVLIELNGGEPDAAGPPKPGPEVMPDGVLAGFLGERRAVLEAQSGTFYPFRDYRIPPKDAAKGSSKDGKDGKDGKRESRGVSGNQLLQGVSMELGQLATEAFWAHDGVRVAKTQQKLYRDYRMLVCDRISALCREQLVALAIESGDPEQIASVMSEVRGGFLAWIPTAIETVIGIERRLLLPEGYEVREVNGHGDCLFDAAGAYIRKDVGTLRREAAAYIRAHPGEFAWAVPGMLASDIADFIEGRGNWDALPGNVAPLALARSQGVTLFVYSRLYDLPQEINPGHNAVHLLYSGSHYDALVPTRQ